MLRRVVLSVPKHGTRVQYDESEVETLRDWIIKQGVVKTALAKLREQPTAVQNKISHLYLGCASISVVLIRVGDVGV
jgi:hypothetical protein